MAHHDPSQQVTDPAPLSKRSASLAAAPVVVFVLALYGVLVSLVGSAFWGLAFLVAISYFASPGCLIASRWLAGPDRWLVGALLGFFASSLGVTILLGPLGWKNATWILPALLIFLAWLVNGLSTKVEGSPSGVGRPKGFDVSDSWWLLAAGTVALAVVAWPLQHVGADVEGGVAYRAYFSADMMTHLAVIAEIQKGAFPLVDPFYAGSEPGALAYYWLFFSVPALIAASFPGVSNQGAILGTNLLGGVLFVCLLYRLFRHLGLDSRRALRLLAVGVLLVSFEGVVGAAMLWLRGEPLSELANLNIDAVGRWIFELSSIDGLHRSLLYTPQHLFSYSCLVVLLLLVQRGEPSDVAGSLIVGTLLGAMAATSIVTAMIAGPWLLVVLAQRFAIGELPLRRLVAVATGVGSVSLGCLALFGWLGFFGGASTSLTLRVPSPAELPAWLGLELGGLTLLLILFWPRSRLPISQQRLLSFWSLVLLAVMAIGCALFLDLRGYEGVWMVWRAGSVLILSLVVMAAIAVAGREFPRWLWVLLAAASMTILIDVYNAQDIGNRSMSAGDFPWTTVVPSDEWQALRWIRDETAEDAIVQWDVRARGPGPWALIPAIGERRMAVGFPIFLLETSKYRARERRRTRRIFTSGDVVEAHSLALAAGIDYLVVGRTELEVRGELVRGLWDDPNRFVPVFAEGDATIFRVAP